MFKNMQADYFDSMFRAKKGYAKVLEPICREWDLTRSELDVRLFLAINPGFDRAADIVTRRGIAESHVSLSVTDLERKGLLKRRVDAGDRRTVHLELTQTALEIAKAGREAQVGFFSRIYAGLTREEIALWQAILSKVSKNIREMEIRRPAQRQLRLRP